jgi:hypothetical protein
LLTEGEVFENEILSRTESTDNPAQKMPEGNSHGKNLIGTSQIELGVKLLILRVFDLLANDNVGYAISQRKRKRIEECFGWLKTIALLQLTRSKRKMPEILSNLGHFVIA